MLALAGLPDKETVNLQIKNGKGFVIGRSVECDLPIVNISVSREHCRIIGDGEGFRIEDLDSHNGTFVNNIPVKSHLLAHGDKITIGNSCLMFLSKPDADLQQAVFDDGSLVTHSTIRLIPVTDSKEFAPDLNALVEFGKAINEIQDFYRLQSRFLEIILELIPAARGAIVKADEDFDDLQSVCFIKDTTLKQTPMQISRTVCRQVLKDQIALLSNDLTEGNLSSSESLNSEGIKSVLCVPLKISGKKGLIYLDSDLAVNKFTKNHLEQVTALSFLISAALENAESIEKLRQENEILRDEFQIETEMIGESKAIKDVYYLISKFAPTDSTVLITGESGTGKELAAKAIHQNSLRKNKPFVAINCAVLSKELLESELFGYEKGSFTGAASQKKGKFEIAEGGTVFLDEIGELEPNIQAKLLRFLQEREFERIGGTKPIKADVRILAATNRNLKQEAEKGNFREDLFFRLNVLQIKMPSLSERKNDIILLSQFFIKKYAEKCGRDVRGVSEKVRQILTQYEWRGNIRELENIIERAVVLSLTETILPEDLPEELLESFKSEPEEVDDFHIQVKEAKQQIIIKALANSNGNYSEAAEKLGIHTNNLHRIIRNLELKNQIKETIINED